MPHKSRWYIEKEVLYAQFWAETTILDARTFLEEMNAYARQGHRPQVHVLVDLSRVTRPLGVAGLAQAVYNFTPDPRLGWAVTVSDRNSALKMTVRLAYQLLGAQRRSFDTLQEALDFLRLSDPDIDWNKADPHVLEDASQEDTAS